MKFGALVPCDKCGVSLVSTEENFIYSMVLSDHYFNPETLEEISQSMLQGNPRPSLSKEQEGEVRRQYLAEYERMKAMLGGGGAVTRGKATAKKRGLWSRIFGR
jgi:hypothetical protein